MSHPLLIKKPSKINEKKYKKALDLGYILVYIGTINIERES